MFGHLNFSQMHNHPDFSNRLWNEEKSEFLVLLLRAVVRGNFSEKKDEFEPAEGLVDRNSFRYLN